MGRRRDAGRSDGGSVARIFAPFEPIASTLASTKLFRGSNRDGGLNAASNAVYRDGYSGSQPSR